MGILKTPIAEKDIIENIFLIKLIKNMLIIQLEYLEVKTK